MSYSVIHKEQSFSELNHRKILRGASIQGILRLLSVEPDDLVVDISIGDGRYALALAFHLAALKGRGTVFACDNDSAILDELERLSEVFGIGQHVYPVRLNTIMPHNLPFSDEQIDCILCIDRVLWRSQPLSYLEEFSRILKLCGTLVIAQTSRYSRLDSPKHFRPATMNDERREILRKAGFEIFDSVELKNYLWCERTMKPVVQFT